MHITHSCAAGNVTKVSTDIAELPFSSNSNAMKHLTDFYVLILMYQYIAPARNESVKATSSALKITQPHALYFATVQVVIAVTTSSKLFRRK